MYLDLALNLRGRIPDQNSIQESQIQNEVKNNYWNLNLLSKILKCVPGLPKSFKKRKKIAILMGEIIKFK